MRRITRKDLRGLYEPAPQSLYDGVHEALASLPEGKGKRKVKKKISTGIILVAALLALSMAGFAASKWDLFRTLTNSAAPIVPLEGAEKLVQANLGSAENEWVTITVEQAAFDGQGVNVLARITPKDMEKYAMFNSWYLGAPEDEYIASWGPTEWEEGTYEIDILEGDVKIVNEDAVQAYYVAGEEVPIPEGQEAAMAEGCLVFRENGKLYKTYSEWWRVEGRRDGRQMLYFDVALNPASGDDALLSSRSADAQSQEDGSVLVWFDGYADAPLADALDLRLTVYITPPEGDEFTEEITFTLPKSDSVREAHYVPEGDGMIGDHVKVRDVNVSFTKVRAYLTVDYDYDPRPEEEMGVWLHPYDAEGNAISTGSGSCDGPGDEDELDFYRQQEEMQSFDEIPEVIVLDAKVIDGDSLGQCVCRLVKSE